MAELILTKLPDNLQNNYATQLGNVLKVKRGKKQKKNEGVTVSLRSNNDGLQNLFKNLIRSINQNTSQQAIPYMGQKKMLKKGVPSVYMNQHPLKPLHSAINKSLKHIEA